MHSPNILSGNTISTQDDFEARVPKGARANFVVNVASNLAYMVLTAVAMAWYIPFLISHLGVAAYGMVPLANMLITYMSTIAEGLNVAINRYLAIDLNRGDKIAANKTFNAALYNSLVAVGVMLPLGVVVIWLFPLLFQTPLGLANDVRILFGCVALTFFLTVIDSNFAVATMICHRFDLRNLVRGLTMTTRMGIAIFLFVLLPAQLWYVGLGYVLAAFVSLSGNWWLWRTLTPQLSVQLVKVDRIRRGELLGLSGWVMVNRIGMLLFLSTDLMVVNIFLGAKMTGLYGTLLLFPELLRSAVDAITSILNPAIMARYALQDFEGLKQLAVRSVKLLAIVLALPVGLLCGFARPFLSIWLSPDFQHLALLLVFLVGYLSVTLATLPLSFVLTSYNKNRIVGIGTLLLGTLNLALSIIFVQWSGWGAIGVAVSTAIVFAIRSLFFISSYSAHVMNLRWWTFYRPLIGGFVGTVGVGLTAYSLAGVWWPQNWLSLGLMAFVVSLGYSIAAYYLGLNSEDRRFLATLIHEPLQKIRKVVMNS